MTPTLRVHLYGAHVADVLDAGQGQAALRYTDGAQASPRRARLSLSLPVRAEAYPAVGGAMRWLRSLLPEGPALQGAVEEYGVPADDTFGLLSVLGRDVAGAAVIVPDNERPDDGPGRYEPVDHAEIADLLASAHRRPLGLNRQRGVRLSLAGVQDKILLHRPLRSRRFYLPVEGAPSTVIAKPEPTDAEAGFEGLATNEALCLAVAREAGLDAANARVAVFGERTCLLVDRYDRLHHRDGVERVHQEDMLAALGRDPWLKYERGNHRKVSPAGGFDGLTPVRNDPGPGLDQFAELLERHMGRASLLQLVQRIAFNIAIGNTDAHARNYSLLLRPDEPVAFAPLYDLISTRAYPDLDTAAAQIVNGVDDIDEVTADDLVEHACGWELPAPVVRARVGQLLDRMAARLPRAVDRTLASGGDAQHAAAIADLIGARLERLR